MKNRDFYRRYPHGWTQKNKKKFCYCIRFYPYNQKKKSLFDVVDKHIFRVIVKCNAAPRHGSRGQK